LNSWKKSATSWCIDNRKYVHPNTLVLDLISCVTRLFWEALDRADYAVTYVKCWAVDRIYGPEPKTAADEQREVEHEKLREAFPMIDLAGTIPVERKLQTDVEPGAIGAAQVSNPTEPRPAVPADRHVE
jgi:hypothetical protein